MRSMVEGVCARCGVHRLSLGANANPYRRPQRGGYTSPAEGACMSAVAERAIEPITDDRLARRNALVLACAQALAGANTHGDRRQRRDHRDRARPRQGVRHGSGEHLCDWPVDRNASRRSDRQALWPASRLRGGRAVRDAGGARLRGRGDLRLVRAAVSRHRLRRALRRGAPVLPLRRRRHRERGVQAEGDLLRAHGGRVRRHFRPAADHPDQGRPPAIPVRRELSRAGRRSRSSPASCSRWCAFPRRRGLRAQAGAGRSRRSSASPG